MANNLNKLRIEFMLTPKELAERLAIDPDQIRRLETMEGDLPEEWAEAIALAFGVPVEALSDPQADIAAIVSTATPSDEPSSRVCRIGARFAIQAVVAKIGGLKLSLDLTEDELASAVQNLILYVEDGAENERATRLTQALQIAALTILQSRGDDPQPDLRDTLQIAQDGALGLVQSFSKIDARRREQASQ